MILQIIQFMFSDFWHWLGSFMMLGVISNGLHGLLSPLFWIKRKQ